MLHLQLVLTNIVPHVVQKQQCPEIKTVDVSMIFAEVIWSILIRESLAFHGRNITVDDWSNTHQSITKHTHFIPLISYIAGLYKQYKLFH